MSLEEIQAIGVVLMFGLFLISEVTTIHRAVYHSKRRRDCLNMAQTIADTEISQAYLKAAKRYNRNKFSWIIGNLVTITGAVLFLLSNN